MMQNQMTETDMLQRWAERLVQLKEKFQESWIELSDQVALKVLRLLENREIEFNQVFDWMIEFAVQLYLLSLNFENNETDSRDLLILLDALPDNKDDADEDRTKSFKLSLRRYFSVKSDEELGKKFWISRQAINKCFNKWYVSISDKRKYRVCLEES